MSKQQTRRKITLDSPLKQVHSNPIKDSHRRPSVFERLGTKAVANASLSQCPSNPKPTDSFCRQWEQNGTCQFGKNCKYVSTHALISPSKRAAIKDASSKINNKECSRRLALSEQGTDHPSRAFDVAAFGWNQEGLENWEKQSCSSSSSSGSSSTGSDSTSSEDSSSSGSSESVESTRHRRHKAKHMNSRKVKNHSSSSDKEHAKRNNIRTGKGISPSKRSSHSASAANVGNLHREMKHTKKRRSRDRSDGHNSPRKGVLGLTSTSKKSLSPPMRLSNANSYKRRSPSPPPKGGKQTVSTSKLGLSSRNVGGQHTVRSPSGHKDKHNRSVSPRSRERERERNREKEDKEREREREREAEREKEREKDRDREKRLREKEREMEKQREREKDRNRSRSPKVKLKDGISRSPRKELKRKESPDHHIKANRLSGGSLKGREDVIGTKHKISPGDSWHRENRKDEKDEERKRADERRHKDDSFKETRLPGGHDEKEHLRERERDRDRERERMHDRDREKDRAKSQLGIPSLLTLNLQHNPNDFNSHIGSGVKDRGLERNRSLERTGHMRNLNMERGRERSLDRISERSRGSERDRRCRNNNGGLEKGLNHSGLEKELTKALARNREQDRTFERSERVQERSLDRGQDRNLVLERGLDRVMDRGLDRSLDRGPDRSLDRGHDRGLERGLKSDRGLDRDRASPRILDRDSDRGLDRGLDRDPVLGRLERGLDRGLDRSSERGLERGSPRDHRFSERSPGDRLFGASHLDLSRESDEKGYENSFEGRRDRGRFSDPNRFDKGAPSNDDRRLGPADLGGFSEERRRGGRPEGRGGQWDARNERKRDHNHEREHVRERDHGPRGFDGGQRTAGHNSAGKRNDWEWDGRGRRSGKDWDGPHRTDNPPQEKEWGRFPPGQGEWSGPPGDRRSAGWNDEWRQPANHSNPAVQPLLNRPPGRMLPLRNDLQNSVSLKPEEHSLDDGSKGKDQSGSGMESKNESKAEGVGADNAENHISNQKRHRETVETDETLAESKRLLLEKDSALEEVLSDISDDADDILNREDSELNHTAHGEATLSMGKENLQGNQQSSLPPQSSQPGPSAGSHTHHRRSVEGADGVGNLGFEEISDGELEEEARARGISDALGVDWASLVAETRPRVKIDKAESTRQRWEGLRLLTYIGVSVRYAGPKLVKFLLKSAFNPQPDKSAVDKDPFSTENVELGKDPCNSPKKVCHGVGNNSGGQEVEGSHNIRDSRDCTELDGKNEIDICDKQTSDTLSVEDSKLKDDVRPHSKASDDVKSESVKESKAADKAVKENSVASRTVEADRNLFCEKLLHPVAGIHTALLERRARRQALFSGSGPYKRALSARRDLSIRRQLCGLPPRETTCDNGPAVDELFRLSLQMLERAS